jgi:hypothetical protein
VADLQQFFTKSLSSSTKLNRRIMYGPSNELWPVPQGTTEVEVHVWGGGGSSCTLSSPAYHSGGGGGGGYARARYSVTSTDCLCITVGGNGGTSSITIPTQSPTSPVSATGGGNATCVPGSPCGTVTGGVGGIGTYTLGPVHPTVYSFTACGGNGAGNLHTLNPRLNAGGGAAGSPRGNGGWGGSSFICGCPTTPGCVGAGGGSIGFATGITQWLESSLPSPNFIFTCSGVTITSPGCKQNYCQQPGPTLDSNTPNIGYHGTPHANVVFNINPVTYPTPPASNVTYVQRVANLNVNNIDNWFYVEDIPGESASELNQYNASSYITFNAQDGGGGTRFASAGLLGGGGGGRCSTFAPNTPQSYAGCAGGSGSNICGPTSTSVPGTPGVVIIYW